VHLYAFLFNEHICPQLASISDRLIPKEAGVEEGIEEEGGSGAGAGARGTPARKQGSVSSGSGGSRTARGTPGSSPGGGAINRLADVMGKYLHSEMKVNSSRKAKGRRKARRKIDSDDSGHGSGINSFESRDDEDDSDITEASQAAAAEKKKRTADDREMKRLHSVGVALASARSVFGDEVNNDVEESKKLYAAQLLKNVRSQLAGPGN
jgi:hypothetical protein